MAILLLDSAPEEPTPPDPDPDPDPEPEPVIAAAMIMLAGVGPAGFAPVAAGSTAPLRPMAAMQYDGGSRSWPLHSDQQYRRVHWVEQAFALGCLTRKGAIKGDPTIGNSLFEIRYLGGRNIAAEVEDRIRNAVPIKSLLADGSVEITRIDHASTPQGQLRVAVYFKNLRVDRNKVLRTDVSI